MLICLKISVSSVKVSTEISKISGDSSSLSGPTTTEIIKKLYSMKNLDEKMTEVVKELEDIIQEIKDSGLENEQKTLDFLDEVNRLSVTF